MASIRDVEVDASASFLGDPGRPAVLVAMMVSRWDEEGMVVYRLVRLEALAAKMAALEASPLHPWGFYSYLGHMDHRENN